MARARAVEVGAQREHDEQPAVGIGVGGARELVEERRPLGRIGADREHLLELVDDDQQARARLEPAQRRVQRNAAERAGQRDARLLAGSQHRARPALAAGQHPRGKRGQQAGAHGRRLAAARWPDHAQQARARQPRHELGDEPLAAEEQLRVPDVERLQPLNGQAACARPG